MTKAHHYILKEFIKIFLKRTKTGLCWHRLLISATGRQKLLLELVASTYKMHVELLPSQWRESVSPPTLSNVLYWQTPTVP